MTALKGFERLESGGLWRPDPQAQRRDVALSFGDATLVLSDAAGRPLTHWSLPAIARLNPGTRPAVFTPDPDGLETLEIDDDTMIDALETVRRHVTRRDRPGRLRLAIGLGVLAACVGAAVLWLPGALRQQVIRTMPDSARIALDERLTAEIGALTGRPCTSLRGGRALRKLAEPLGAGPVVVVPGELPAPLALPGGTVVLDRAMVELPEDPAVPAGHILIARTRAAGADPLEALLRRAGPVATLELLTSGRLGDGPLRREAEALLRATPPLPATEAITAQFARAGVPLTPWARDYDITGESVLPLIEADQISPQQAAPLLSDGDWLSLQAICGG